ncbi:MAG TPA: hypothetical protein VNS09_07850 [Solirubrobacter sp.]|nr:hypothetical protein [Solirubrobacter sp.]
MSVLTAGAVLALAWAGCGGSSSPSAATPTPSAAATPCTDVAKPFGSPPPGGFAFKKVDEATRAKTVAALHLDEAGGKVQMRAAQRAGLTLGTVVRVPSSKPDAYALELLRAAEQAGAEIQRGSTYAVLPLQGGSAVAVGVRGCATLLVNAPDPTAVPFIADAVFGA